MAAPSGQLKASRYFAALVVIIGIIYALVIFGGSKPLPKLGLDLEGGTSMTLSATLPGGRVPDAAKLEQARQIISERVNQTGVSEPEVVIEGNKNIIVNVAGQTRESDLRKLVEPAELRFRKVLQTSPDASGDTSPTPSASASASASATPGSSASASAAPGASASGSAAPSAAASGAVSPGPGASGASSASASAEPLSLSAEAQRHRDAVIAKLGDAYGFAQQLPDPDPQQPPDPQTMAFMSPFGKLSADDVSVLPADVQFKVPTISCRQLDGRPTSSIQDPKQKVVACGRESGSPVKYFLDVAKVVGEDVSTASFGSDPTKGWFVTLSFKSGGQDKWTNLTKEAYDNGAKHAVAIVLDNSVVSAPAIQGVIPGDATIDGTFTKEEVDTLSRQLKYGSLPLGFTIESVDSVTATIGLQQMKAGILAGAIGLILVVIYCLIYYRVLGLVVIASLVVSGAAVYGCLVILGRQIGFSLSLAGIAGFIVAIGITADSFVVFFERLKDEVRDGRTVRSAVPRAWVRARRTILSADTVSFLAAAVLYILAVGPVKGFAFTLGLSTVIDLMVVFLFTHPLVSVLVRQNLFTSPRISGLGNKQSDRVVATAHSRGGLGAARPKES